jgi:hypothetical protein
VDQSHGRIYLFTIFGTRALSLEATRPVHTQVAGNPEDVAAARSLSDLSHMVYTSVDEESAEFVIISQCPQDTTTASSPCFVGPLCPVSRLAPL